MGEGGLWNEVTCMSLVAWLSTQVIIRERERGTHWDGDYVVTRLHVDATNLLPGVVTDTTVRSMAR